jgi:putative phosphoesterase
MRIAIVSDIHGNVTALEAVIGDLKTTAPDVVLHGGDLAHAGARPAEAVDRIRELVWPGVRGNTDEMLWAPEELRGFAARVPQLRNLMAAIEEMIPTTCAWLGEERIAWLKTMPLVQRVESVALVHASPNDLWRAPLPDATDAELTETYSELQAPVVVYGHIHRSYVRELPGMTVANAGSVNLSYDGDARASYLIVDENKATIRRVEYDLEREIELLRARDCRTRNGLAAQCAPGGTFLWRTLKDGEG